MNNRIDLYVEFDLKNKIIHIPFNKFTSDPIRKQKQILMYYLMIPKGTDLVYPELGINPNALNSDHAVLVIEINNLIQLINNTFGFNIQLVSVNYNSISKTLDIVVKINNVTENIVIDNYDVLEITNLT